MSIGTLWQELQRRRVFRVIAGYGVAAFAVLQVVEPIMHALHLPDAVLTYCVIALGLGFPIAVVLAWAFDVNAGAIERTPPAATPGLRGPRLLLVLSGLGLLAAAPGLAWYLWARGRALPATAEAEEALKARLDAVPPASELRPLPSIAVLPLVNMSSDPEQEYFSDGLSEELLNLLAQLPQLRVIARTSSFSFKGKNVDVATIAKALDVGHVLEGSVRKSGNKLRVTAQLIRAADSSHLWSQTYDRELTDVFKVQDEIATAVVAALKVKLLPSQVVTSPHRTGNTEAYDQFLLGRQIMRRGSFADLQRAVTALEQAVALDPGFATAYGTLGAAQIGLAEFQASQAQRLAGHRVAVANLEKAIALDPNLAEAYLDRAWYRCNLQWDWKGGEEDLARGAAADPNQYAEIASFGGGQACFRLSRVQDALAHDRKQLASDPLSVGAWQYYGLHLMLVPGGTPQARAALQRAIDLSPDAGWPRYMIGLLDLQDGKAEAALAQFRRAGPGLGVAGTAMAEHTLGHAEKSRKALGELEVKYPAGFAIQIAQVHAWRGERDQAFEWLDRAVLQHDAGVVRLRYDLPFEGLRDDPRFAALVRKLGLPE